ALGGHFGKEGPPLLVPVGEDLLRHLRVDAIGERIAARGDDEPDGGGSRRRRRLLRPAWVDGHLRDATDEARYDERAVDHYPADNLRLRRAQATLVAQVPEQ